MEIHRHDRRGTADDGVTFPEKAAAPCAIAGGDDSFGLGADVMSFESDSKNILNVVVVIAVVVWLLRAFGVLESLGMIQVGR